VLTSVFIVATPTRTAEAVMKLLAMRAPFSVERAAGHDEWKIATSDRSAAALLEQYTKPVEPRS
jgi:hypothetical protein